MQIGHAGITRDLLAAAELMPESDYVFKPTSMPEARTFAAVIAHTSGEMSGACARLNGVANPGQPTPTRSCLQSPSSSRRCEMR